MSSGHGMHALARWLETLEPGHIVTLNEAVVAIPHLARSSVSALLNRRSQDQAWGLRKLGAGTYVWREAVPAPVVELARPDPPAPPPTPSFREELVLVVIRELDDGTGRVLCSGEAGALYVVRRLET